MRLFWVTFKLCDTCKLVQKQIKSALITKALLETLKLHWNGPFAWFSVPSPLVVAHVWKRICVKPNAKVLSLYSSFSEVSQHFERWFVSLVFPALPSAPLILAFWPLLYCCFPLKLLMSYSKIKISFFEFSKLYKIFVYLLFPSNASLFPQHLRICWPFFGSFLNLLIFVSFWKHWRPHELTWFLQYFFASLVFWSYLL